MNDWVIVGETAKSLRQNKGEILGIYATNYRAKYSDYVWEPEVYDFVHKNGTVKGFPAVVFAEEAALKTATARQNRVTPITTQTLVTLLLLLEKQWQERATAGIWIMK